MEEAVYFVGFSYFPRIGPVRMKKLLEAFSNIQTAWEADAPRLMDAGIEEKCATDFVAFRSDFNLAEAWQKTLDNEIQVITINDPEYPELLREIFDPPSQLFVRGKLPELDYIGLGVVGTRKMTSYGAHVLENIIPPLVQSRLTIISGLALGIDARAHEITLRAGGTALAVLGSGVDDKSIHPSTNRQLAREILEHGGAIISEFPPGTPPLQHHFPIRNRIVSGLSRGVLIIEADVASGSLITARHALDQNREVFAVPGDITRSSAQGPNSLIKMGAHPVTEAQDILNAFDAKSVALPPPVFEPENEQEAMLLELLKSEPLHIDMIIQSSNLDTRTVSATLTMMEMKGMVRSLGGMRYTLTR